MTTRDRVPVPRRRTAAATAPRSAAGRRLQAEAQAALATADLAARSPEELRQMVRDLQVRRIQLELQNEARRHVAARRTRDAHERAGFDAVASHTAVLDRHGIIVATNAAWEDFARDNPGADGTVSRDCGVGADYLAVCRRSVGPSAEGAQAAHDGILAVLEGRLPSFGHE